MQKNLKSMDKAAIGIGTLIVFIAIVLVAAIAASVLVQTSSYLEMQAIKSGKNTVIETSSGIKVESVAGYNTSGSIIKLGIEIMLLAGSDPIDLSQTIIEISDGNSKKVLKYNSELTNSSDIDGDVFSNGVFGSGTTFGIIVLQDADSSCTLDSPVMDFGDHVFLGVDSNSLFNGINPRTSINGMVICEQGAPGIIGFTTPSSYSQPIVFLH